MNLPNANEVVVAPGNFFAPVSRPFNSVENWAIRREMMNLPAARIPICPRSLRAAPHPPAGSSCPRPGRLASRPGSFEFGPTAKKFLLPCLAALLFGKTLSYVVELFAGILFLLR